MMFERRVSAAIMATEPGQPRRERKRSIRIGRLNLFGVLHRCFRPKRIGRRIAISSALGIGCASPVVVDAEHHCDAARGEAWLVVGLTAGVAEAGFLSRSSSACQHSFAVRRRPGVPVSRPGVRSMSAPCAPSAALTAEVLFLPPAWLALQCRQIKARHLPWCGSPTGTRAEQGTR